MAIDLDALEAVLAKATPGEWLFDPDDPYMGEHDGWIFAGPIGIIEAQNDFDAAAIVALHNAAPALIAEHRALLARVEALEAEVTRLRGPLAEFARGYGPGDGDSKALEPKP